MGNHFSCGVLLRRIAVWGVICLLFGCGNGSSLDGGIGNSVVSITPDDGDIDVAVTRTITVTCAEDVVVGDVSGVTLTGISGDISVTVTSDGKNFLIDPVPLLEKNREYTVTIPGGAIIGVDDNIVLSFTTVQITFTEQTGVVVSDVANASIGRSDMSNNIAVSESGIIHVVWKVPDVMTDPSGVNDGIYYTRSIDGGLSFEPSIRVRDASGLPINSRSYIDPEIACSGVDNVYIAYPTSDQQMEVVRSTDSGVSWEVPMVVGTAGTLSEQKHITTDGDNIYISANDGDMPLADSVDNGGNTFILSTDSGVSFEDPVTGLMGYPLHALLVNPLNGDIYIVGTEPTGVNEPTPVFYVRSTDQGGTFEAPVNTGEIISHAGYCFDRLGRIIVVGRDGTLLIGDMNTDVWTRSSVIATASKPLQSTMTVDGDNTIYRVGTDAVDSRIHVTYSKDDGVSFTEIDIDSGTYPNAASSVNMTGVAMVYMEGGVIYYAYRNP
ncbi:MAG: Ig-like domain-containing protein [Deltaproteobacteria bacterium]|nr:Ig-like domain-containing protein [Deltaproteobacteria bacterium]